MAPARIINSYSDVDFAFSLIVSSERSLFSYEVAEISGGAPSAPTVSGVKRVYKREVIG